ncbi:membrane assembly protein AsmA [Rhodanobacter sp. FW510-R12]|uniref:AsmA family protein n=1 Tax=unclassified Rhodanobacter TaxID=2621553 RepID=UPI0007A9921A|nr:MULTISPECIES: AsmA family protein [unclassified Rhodanobacter]KZC18136.1 membrane assembly protein AsmA [Rhodanobacter sp. FW104-R8]KZC25794.1 membrane assembly protein AsmA [Rhodanobacter sp. FW510-T8]KZC33557.1 membrane assembly protein AsmA [Rhodanobacter sp. FW510-R10]
MSRRLRLTLLLLGGLALAAVLAAVVAVYLLLQPERFTRMLQTQARSAGLELNLSSPASPTLFPRPALDLNGITLNAAGASAPILLAARGQLVLPWHTLFGGPTVISQLQIDSPRVDLDALQEWLAALPSHPVGSPPNIPRIDTGVDINHGSVVRGNAVLLDNVSLEAGRLISGQPFPLNLSATTAAHTPLQLRLSATPRIEGSTLQLDNVSLHLAQGGTTTLTLAGNARWHGAADAAANLAGRLDQAKAGQYDISLRLTPANQNDPLLLALKLDGPANHADLHLPPLALAHWWSQLSDPQGPQLSMPSGNGHAEIARVDVGSVAIEGLTIRAGDAAPAPAGTTAKPATGKQP